MEEKGFSVKKLPIYSDDSEADEIIARIMKPKGELATISIDPSGYIAFVEFPKDRLPRANHYHEKKVEMLYLARGRVRLYVRKGNQPDAFVYETVVEEGSLIQIHPGYAHAYVTEVPGFGIEFSPMSYSRDDKVRDFVLHPQK